jgi:putative SOS response-associated peptidase YedK
LFVTKPFKISGKPNMCGRYNFVMTPTMIDYLDQLGVSVTLPDQYNIAPTESVPIILEADGKRECHLARWWLTPSWSSGPDTKYSMFNARAENLESSRAYKGPFHHKRCIIPASSFMEWKTEQGAKQPYEILRQDGQPIAMAGLWDICNEELVSCSIVTTKASPAMEAIHNRMPVMLDAEGVKQWLDMTSDICSLTPLMGDQPAYPLKAHPVDKVINNGKVKKAPVSVGDYTLL